jgi:hypothetical protein
MLSRVALQRTMTRRTTAEVRLPASAAPRAYGRSIDQRAGWPLIGPRGPASRRHSAYGRSSLLDRSMSTTWLMYAGMSCRTVAGLNVGTLNVHTGFAVCTSNSVV